VGGVSLGAQLAGTAAGVAIAVIGGAITYYSIKAITGLRLDPEQEFEGADLSIHRISASHERPSEH
jgi:Amt family ammonium transporter